MKIIGLTGGIGMGKSTIARVFRRAHIPVFDADAVVRRLQAPGGAALPAIAAAFPGTVRDANLDRAALRARVLADPAALRRLEAILHPMVHQAQRRFLALARSRHCRAAVLDVPLLLETGGQRATDLVVVISAPAGIQKQRLRRRGIGAREAERLVALQMPDKDKRAHADVILWTGLSRHHSFRRTRRLILDIVTCLDRSCSIPKPRAWTRRRVIASSKWRRWS